MWELTGVLMMRFFFFAQLIFTFGCSPDVPPENLGDKPPPARTSSSTDEEKPKPAAGDRLIPTRTGSDWPTFLGLKADGSSPERGILTDWPKAGLKKIWEATLGQGYAPPVIAAGRLFHFDRFGDRARLTCRNAETGELVWKAEYDTDYEDQYGYDPGPRACPVVDGERVFAHGVEGRVTAYQVANGKEIWSVDTKKNYHFHKNFFGVGSAPVVHGDLLIVAVGGSPKGPRPFDLRDAKGDGSGIVAFDKVTGAQKYRFSDELASYSSPIITTFNTKPTGLYFARGGLVGFDPDTGKERFTYKWRAKMLESVNAANPVVVGDTIIISECYEKGSVCLRVKADWSIEEVWSDKNQETKDKTLLSHWSTPIVDGKFGFGCSGRHTPEGDLRCFELATGKVAWVEARTRRCTLARIDGHALALAEDGTLTLFSLNSEKFTPVAKWKDNPDLAYPCWAPPVISHGLLYLRGEGKLVCYELIPKK